MNNLKIFHELSSDIERFTLIEKTNRYKILFFSQGFWAILYYRCSRCVYKNVNVPILRQILLSVMFIWRKLIELITNINIPWSVEIGLGLYIAHFGPIIVHPDVRIGENCTLSQGVTIGIKHGGYYSGVPNIGNRVFIAPNAIVIGGVEIGDDVMIGAGAVVTKPVSPCSVIVGNPSKVISNTGSFNYISYVGMENDQSRIKAIEHSQKT